MGVPVQANSRLTAQLQYNRSLPPLNIIDKSAGRSENLDFAHSVSAGLKAKPRFIESRFLYDARGSLLFEQITRQPEYYLTRTEASILADRATAIRKISGPVHLIELGSGNSEKTDHLLQAWISLDRNVRYIPVDVSRTSLAKARRGITHHYPTVQVKPINTDYREAFPAFKQFSPAMILFLGSSIGNFDDNEMSSFLQELSEAMTPGDFFLGGFDLVKSSRLIEAAYNDAAGVTADFTRNLFVRMNRELGSNVPPGIVEHRAIYDEQKERVEIDAFFTEPREIAVEPLGEYFPVGKGERLRTEISRKFRLEKLVPYLESFGFQTRRVFTDPRKWFAVILLQKEG